MCKLHANCLDVGKQCRGGEVYAAFASALSLSALASDHLTRFASGGLAECRRGEAEGCAGRQGSHNGHRGLQPEGWGFHDRIHEVSV